MLVAANVVAGQVIRGVEHQVRLAPAHGPAVAHRDGRGHGCAAAPLEHRHKLARLRLEHREIARMFREQRAEHALHHLVGLGAVGADHQ